MIQWMHTLSKSWAATLLMGALTLSFVVWGIADVFSGVSTTGVATVGSTDLGLADRGHLGAVAYVELVQAHAPHHKGQGQRTHYQGGDPVLGK